MQEDLSREIKRDLPTRWLGREMIYMSIASSTNDAAIEGASLDRPEGLVALAEQQIAGRGRMGRLWEAPPGSSILMSLLLRPTLPPARIFLLTMLAGSAVCAAVEHVAAVNCDLKWPNDILLGGKKLGGILTETGMSSEGIDFAVVGLGLNVNFDTAAIPEIADIATSLSLHLGHEIARAPLAQRILLEVENRYEAAQRGDHEAILAEWRSRLSTLGKQVVVSDGEASETGLAYDVDLDGTLLLRRDDGSMFRAVTGDVSLRESW